MHPKSTATQGSLIVAGVLLAVSHAHLRGETSPTSPQGTAGQGPQVDLGYPAHQDGGHADWWHRLQDWTIGLLGGVHPHADDHGHEEHLEPLAVTLFSGRTELFAELPPLVLGEASELLVHLTRLTDFKPVTEGEVRVTLSGGGAPDESFASPAPARPGLFRVKVTPAVPGERRVHLVLATPDLQDSHDLGLLPVHPDQEAAEAAAGAETPDGGGVLLLKEQQWRSDFGTAVAAQRLLRGSVPATGLLRPSADGEAHVTTPIDGHLRPAPEGFPYTGMRVEANQIIAYLVHKLGGDADVAGLELGVTRATSARDLARQERERLDALWQQRSIPYREVLQARSGEEVADAELAAARKRLPQVQRTPEGEAAGVPVRAPISGVVARVEVAAGGFVEEGDRLFHLVDAKRLSLEARVAEADIGQIRQPRGAWFRVQGFESVFEVSTQNQREHLGRLSGGERSGISDLRPGSGAQPGRHRRDRRRPARRCAGAHRRSRARAHRPRHRTRHGVRQGVPGGGGGHPEATRGQYPGPDRAAGRGLGGAPGGPAGRHGDRDQALPAGGLYPTRGGQRGGRPA